MRRGCCSRNRARRLFLARRWRALAATSPNMRRRQSVISWSRRRHSCRNARSIVLDPRRHDAAASARLQNHECRFVPVQAEAHVWFRRDKWTDTPLPPEEPAARTHPTVQSSLPSWVERDDASNAEIVDAAGRSVARFPALIRRDDRPELNVPTIGSVHHSVCQPKPGRTGRLGFHYAPPKVLGYGYPISAITVTHRAIHSVRPCCRVSYTEAHANGHTYTAAYRENGPASANNHGWLKLQHDIGVRMNDAIAVISLLSVRFGRGAQCSELSANAPSRRNRRFSGGPGQSPCHHREWCAREHSRESRRLNDELAGILSTVEGADAEPTTQLVAAASALERALAVVLARWSEVQRTRFRGN